MSIFGQYQTRFEDTQQEEYSLEEYLEICKKDSSAYATAPERFLLAIGEPELIDTAKDPRLSRIFSNKIIKRYPEFSDFYGMEECIEQIVSFFPPCRAGTRRKKADSLPPGSGRRRQIFTCRKAQGADGKTTHLLTEGFADPGIAARTFQSDPKTRKFSQEEYGIPQRYVQAIMSPWAAKRLKEYNGDIRQFRVVKQYPSQLNQLGVAKDGTGRREQSGHFCTGRQGRYTQTRGNSNRTTPMLTVSPVACAMRTRAFSNSSKCSRRRSRSCTRC